MSWKQNTMRGMRSNSMINQPTGGGSKKSGLATSNLGSAGVGLLHGRTYMGGPRGVQANYQNQDLVFHYKSYIGGIGHSVGGRSLGRMMDGVRIPNKKSDNKKSDEYVCQNGRCVWARGGAPKHICEGGCVGESYICDTNTLKCVLGPYGRPKSECEGICKALPLCPSPKNIKAYEVPSTTPRTKEGCNQYYFRSMLGVDGNPYYRCTNVMDRNNQPICGGMLIPANKCRPIQ